MKGHLLLRFIALAALLLIVTLAPDMAHAAEGGLDGTRLSLLWALPFAGILLCIATGPVLYHHLWEHHYGKFAAFWAALVIVPLFFVTDATTVVHTLSHTVLLEYLPFILLLLALFTVAGGIYVEGNLHDSVFTNTALLGFGTLIASVVGTTGASMILIRPLIRANDDRRTNVHVVVFFIFLVSNIGGSLSPLGDPPLFLGFLRGVDFFWTTVHIFPETLFAAGIVLAIFMVLDVWLHHREGNFACEERSDAGFAVASARQDQPAAAGRDHRRNPDERELEARHHVHRARHAARIAGFAARRDLRAGDICVAVADQDRAPQGQRFQMGADQEVALLFAGIFICIVPVMAMLQAGAQGPVCAAGGPRQPCRRYAEQCRLFLAHRHPVVVPRQCANLSGVLRTHRR